jgi:predicted alpha-1,2-mannosidase
MKNSNGILSFLLTIIMLNACTGQRFDEAIVAKNTPMAEIADDGIPAIIEAAAPVNFVDPLIGTGGNGHTFPGALLPFGMVQLSPDTGGMTGNWLSSGWNWCAGYHYSDGTIIGFSHLHRSGMGIGDWGDILMMPCTGPLKIKPGSDEHPREGYRSRFSHGEEVATPGYYRVRLSDYNILAELTTTLRTGFHRYTFPKSDTTHILIDLDWGLGDIPFGCSIEIVGDNRIEGVRKSIGAVLYQKAYFCAEFSKPFGSFGVWKGGKEKPGERKAGGKGIGAYVNYRTSEREVILVKVGISYTGPEQARQNLASEVPHWDFDSIKNRARAVWNKELSKIVISPRQAESGKMSADRKKIFYTALYHSLMFPSIFSDHDGTYAPVGNMAPKPHKAVGYDYYSDFALWDTFRAEMPLLTLLVPLRVNDMIRTLVAVYKESGWLPSPQMFGNFHSEQMIGDHAASVILDAYMKGIRNFDVKKAYEGLWKNAMLCGENLIPALGYGVGRFSLKSYRNLGYLPADFNVEPKSPLFLVANIYNQAVSITLEYAYDDECVALLAKNLGKHNDYDYFSKRALNYRNLFDKKTGFMRGKSFTGAWMNAGDFNPVTNYAYYAEGNAWQYTWSVMHDIKGLVTLMGGRDAFVKKLDELFKVTDQIVTNEFFSADIAGMIGQYAHGNEPSHHVVYLYDYAGQPWKTQEWVRTVMDKFYKSSPDGLCGNDDMGQMSAWYVFSSLGLYPLHPGIYAIGSPLFERAEINLAEGKLIIEAKNISSNNKYIQDAKLDGRPLRRPWLAHSEIRKGGNLVFIMGSNPNKKWGSNPEEAPPSLAEIINTLK